MFSLYFRVFKYVLIIVELEGNTGHPGFFLGWWRELQKDRNPWSGRKTALVFCSDIGQIKIALMNMKSMNNNQNQNSFFVPHRGKLQ